jgi:hypothetical protein
MPCSWGQFPPIYPQLVLRPIGHEHLWGNFKWLNVCSIRKCFCYLPCTKGGSAVKRELSPNLHLKILPPILDLQQVLLCHPLPTFKVRTHADQCMQKIYDNVTSVICDLTVSPANKTMYPWSRLQHCWTCFQGTRTSPGYLYCSFSLICRVAGPLQLHASFNCLLPMTISLDFRLVLSKVSNNYELTVSSPDHQTQIVNIKSVRVVFAPGLRHSSHSLTPRYVRKQIKCAIWSWNLIHGRPRT